MMSKNRIIKAGMAYTIGNYFIKGLNFLTIPIFARILSTSDYGIYNAFVAYESILSILIGLAIHTSYRNAYLKYEVEKKTESSENFNTYTSNTLILIIINTLICYITTNVICPQIAGAMKLDTLQLNLLILYAFSSAVILCFNSKVALTYQYNSFLTVSFINVVGNIVISIFLIETIYEERRYMGRIVGTVVPIFVLAMVILFQWIRNSKPGKLKSYLGWGIKYSLPIIPHGISQIILSQFDRIMINFMIGAAQAGIYSFSYNIYSIIAVTYTSIDTVWGQWFYEKMYDKNYKAIKVYSSIYMILMMIFSLIMMFVSPELILVLGTTKYESAVYCVIPIVAGGYFAYLYTIPCQIEYYYEKTGYIAIGTISAAGINIFSNYFFINKYGFISAAYTTLITYIIYFLFHYLLAWKIQKKCIFSTLVVLVCSSTIILGVFITQFFIDAVIFRWFIVLLLGSGGIIIAEKYLKIISKLLQK